MKIIGWVCEHSAVAMVTLSETIVGTNIFLGNFKLLCSRHVGTRLYVGDFQSWGEGGALIPTWSSRYHSLTTMETRLYVGDFQSWGHSSLPGARGITVWLPWTTIKWLVLWLLFFDFVFSLPCCVVVYSRRKKSNPVLKREMSIFLRYSNKLL